MEVPELRPSILAASQLVQPEHGVAEEARVLLPVQIMSLHLGIPLRVAEEDTVAGAEAVAEELTTPLAALAEREERREPPGEAEEALTADKLEGPHPATGAMGEAQAPTAQPAPLVHRATLRALEVQRELAPGLLVKVVEPAMLPVAVEAEVRMERPIFRKSSLVRAAAEQDRRKAETPDTTAQGEETAVE